MAMQHAIPLVYNILSSLLHLEKSHLSFSSFSDEVFPQSLHVITFRAVQTLYYV